LFCREIFLVPIRATKYTPCLGAIQRNGKDGMMHGIADTGEGPIG